MTVLPMRFSPAVSPGLARPHACAPTCVFACSLNILNKWTLSLYGFRFPIILSMAHMLFSAAALAPIMCTKAHRDQHVNTITKQWMGLVAIGFFFAINVSAPWG